MFSFVIEVFQVISVDSSLPWRSGGGVNQFPSFTLSFVKPFVLRRWTWQITALWLAKKRGRAFVWHQSDIGGDEILL